ncbi:hypothetical protein MOSE0_H08614 [Monosporozyma servazzii]
MYKNFSEASQCIPVVSDFKSFSEYKRWRAVVESIRDFYELDDKTLLLIINMKISDKIVHSLCDRKFATTEEFWTWTDRAYSDSFDAERNEYLYILTHPPDYIRTMTDYIYHFERYLRELPGLFEKESEKFAIFTMPLDPEVVSRIVSTSPKTFEDAKVLAKAASLLLHGAVFREGLTRTPALILINQHSFPVDTTSPNTNEQDMDDNNNAPCHYCKKLGHLSQHCRSRKQNISQSIGRPRRLKQQNRKRIYFNTQGKN